MKVDHARGCQEFSILSEDRLTFKEAAKILGVHLASVWRFALKGSRGVKLESALIGAGKRYTTRQALDRFLDRLNKREIEKAIPATRPLSRRRRERQIEAAKEEQQRDGY